MLENYDPIKKKSDFKRINNIIYINNKKLKII